MAAKKKIGPKKIIGKMKLADAIHAVETDYPGTIFYVGSESSYFFIGTAEEFDRDIAKIGAEYKKQFRGANKRTSRELKDELMDLSSYKNRDEFSEKIYDRSEDLIRNILKTSKYHDAYHNWIDIDKRTVKECYVRDAIGEFNEGGLVMIVLGYENGKWAFYHEYKTKTVEHEPNTVYIQPKEEKDA